MKIETKQKIVLEILAFIWGLNLWYAGLSLFYNVTCYYYVDIIFSIVMLFVIFFIMVKVNNYFEK